MPTLSIAMVIIDRAGGSPIGLILVGHEDLRWTCHLLHKAIEDATGFSRCPSCADGEAQRLNILKFVAHQINIGMAIRAIPTQRDIIREIFAM